MSKRRDAMRLTPFLIAKQATTPNLAKSSFLIDEMGIRSESPVKKGRIIAEHGPAKAMLYGFTFTIQRAGKRIISPVTPKWYQTVRTSTTDYVNRCKQAVINQKERG